MPLRGGRPPGTKQGEAHFKAMAKEGTFIRREKRRSIKESVVFNSEMRNQIFLYGIIFSLLRENHKRTGKAMTKLGNKRQRLNGIRIGF